MRQLLKNLLVAAILILPSCARETTIPDEELAQIFRDAFLANAYIYEKEVQFDSVQVYQPIFDKYGYTAEDVAFTVGSFSKRKSARLSDVVELAIDMLKDGEAHYKLEATILDSIDARALREATQRIYTDSLIEFYALKDTLNVRVELDSLEAGKYKIEYDYLIDSLDDNRSSYRFVSWAEAPDDERRRGLSTTYMRKHYVATASRQLTLDTLTHKFVMLLADTYERKRKPHITIKNLTIDYTPSTDEALEQLLRRNLDIRIFANDFFGVQQEADSLQLPAL